jgi:hypothetical protein
MVDNRIHGEGSKRQGAGIDVRATQRRNGSGFGARVATLALMFGSLAPPAFAKISAAPGKDGAPPDPQDEAAADALNDALEGPDPGQSTEEWQEELVAAHEAVYGTGIDFDMSPPPDVDAVSCQIAENTEDTGCDGDPTWVNISDPYDIVLSRKQHCLYPSYVDCLQAGQSVTFCKKYVLNCHEGEPTQASAKVSFDARQCTTSKLCICAQSQGEITFHGSTETSGDEVCFSVSYFEYDGPFPGQVEPEIQQLIDENGGELCLPLECVE